MLTAEICFSQVRPTPLNNADFKTDANMGNHRLTNVNAIVFYDTGTNLLINATTFMSLFNGESKKLVDENTPQYLFVSNGIPYVTSTNGLRTVILQNDTAFIRQGEYQASVTNLDVMGNLIISTPSSVDSSQYVVTEASLTNGAIAELKIERFYFFVTNGVLKVRDTSNGNLYPITGL